MLEAHLPHALDKLVQRHLGRTGLTYEDLCGKGAHKIPFSQVEVQRAAEYACEDSEMCLHVHQVLWPRIEADEKLRDVYQRIEMPIAGLLARIERAGVLIDADLLAAQSRELAERMLALEAQAYELAGQPFNLGSPKQIGEILFGKLGLPIGRRTAGGAPSTDEAELEKLAADYPLPARLLEHRSLAKLKGTYTDKLPQMVESAHRPRAHQLCAGGGGHRAALQQRAQPAEHTDPHARGTARARGLRRAAGAFASSAPTIRRSSCG